jgi:organic radical activating enzyme
MIKEKILCLVDNSSKEAIGNQIAQEFSKKCNIRFIGLLSKQTDYDFGVYHVGPYDMDTKTIISIAKKYFNKVILLDQKQEQYSHFRIFLSMFKLIKDMRNQGIEIEEQNTQIFKYLYDWEDIFEKNRNICALPFFECHDHSNGGITLCGRSMNHPIVEENTFDNSIEAWKYGEKINDIRKKIVLGEKIDHCRGCHVYEEKNIRDQRWNYSFNWLAKLKILNIEDLKKKSTPLHYDIRLKNKCNLMCRMCDAKYSHLIEKENKKITDSKFKKLFVYENKNKFNGSLQNIDVENLSSMSSVYITGGEPTINNDLYSFLQRCINIKKTNFELNIQTNAARTNLKLLNLLKHFTCITMNCSIDGVGKVNEYQRWRIKNQEQEKNIYKFQQQGHKIHLIHVITIYNISTIGKTLKYFDESFPFASIQLQIAASPKNVLNPYNHLDRNTVLLSIIEAKTSKCYWHNESGTTAIINHLHDFYNNPNAKPDYEELKNFFYYNDVLDKQRGSLLADYIPDLELIRQKLKINTL